MISQLLASILVLALFGAVVLDAISIHTSQTGIAVIPVDVETVTKIIEVPFTLSSHYTDTETVTKTIAAAPQTTQFTVTETAENRVYIIVTETEVLTTTVGDVSTVTSLLTFTAIESQASALLPVRYLSDLLLLLRLFV